MDQRKRYQIFVSSTFADLEEERGKVMAAILTLDCFPAGMELFPAMDEAIFEYIKRIIDDSDYYLLIIGGRYGSLAEDGISWTEKEYDYAVSKGIPVIVIDHRDFTQLPANKTDQDNKKRKKLIAFKKKVSTGRLIAKWTNADDLALAVAKSLPKVMELHPGKGWVQVENEISGISQREIDSLIKTIVGHQNEIIFLEAEIKEKEEDIKKKDELLEQMKKDLWENKVDLRKKDYAFRTLRSSYEASQREIERLKKRMKVFKTELKKLKALLGQYPQTSMFTVNGISFEMVYIEGGTFMMGGNDDDKGAFDNEKPLHKVTLSDYWMGETQVTQELWLAVMGENPSAFKGDLKCPVENVSWMDCQKFIQKLNSLTGKKFRLPTEAQWEFAARGGNIGKDHHYRYAGSNDIFDVAWFLENSDSKTHPVGEREPNELGLYDMSGNVWEWCNDSYDENYYCNSPSVNPPGPSIGSTRLIRGGCSDNGTRYCRISHRGFWEQKDVDKDLGLRLAL